jgi:hypothetical protein
MQDSDAMIDVDAHFQTVFELTGLMAKGLALLDSIEFQLANPLEF